MNKRRRISDFSGRLVLGPANVINERRAVSGMVRVLEEPGLQRIVGSFGIATEMQINKVTLSMDHSSWKS